MTAYLCPTEGQNQIPIMIPVGHKLSSLMAFVKQSLHQTYRLDWPSITLSLVQWEDCHVLCVTVSPYPTYTVGSPAHSAFSDVWILVFLLPLSRPFGFLSNLSDKSCRKRDSWSIISPRMSSSVHKPSLEWKILWDFHSCKRLNSWIEVFPLLSFCEDHNSEIIPMTLICQQLRWQWHLNV